MNKCYLAPKVASAAFFIRFLGCFSRKRIYVEAYCATILFICSPFYCPAI